jgi:O-antigen/teichoic acid export membrane protein
MLGWSIVLFAVGLQTSLILTPFTVYSPRYAPQSRAFYSGSTLIYQLVLSGLATVLLSVMGLALHWAGGPQGLTGVMWVLAVSIAFLLLREFARGDSFARLRVGVALVVDSGVAICQIGGLLILVHGGRMSAESALCVTGIASGIAGLSWLIFSRRDFAIHPQQIIGDFKNNWFFGRWVFASGCLYSASVDIYPWLLAISYGTSAAGIWGVCRSTVALANPVLFGYQNYIGPKIAHSYVQAKGLPLLTSIRRDCLIVCLLLAPVVPFLFLFGDRFVAVLYGRSYAGNGAVISVLACGLLLSAATFSLSRGLFVLERASADFAVNSMALFVALSMGSWLVWSLGPLGAAIGLLTASVAGFVIRWIVLSRAIARSSPYGALQQRV